MLHRLALLWQQYDVVAGEFAQPLSGFQDGFGSTTTKLVVYSKGTTNERTNGHRSGVWTSFGM